MREFDEMMSDHGDLEGCLGELIQEDGACPWCFARLRERQVFPDSDDCEIYCPECEWIGEVS